MMKTHRDVVIVGAGAAGLSAGIVLARARADTVIVDDGKPRNAPAAHIHGFLSQDGVSPSDFLAAGRNEFTLYGGELEHGRIVDATRRAGGDFAITLDTDAVVHARTVLVATGLTDELPDIPGVRERWGTDVHHCPHCHGYEVRGQPVVVIGGTMTEMSLHQAALLRRQSTDVTFCPNGTDLTDNDRARLTAFGVRIVDGTVGRLLTDSGVLTGTEFIDGRTVDCDVVFVAPRPRPNDAVLKALGCDTDPTTGLVQADAAGQTSVPGVWAAGNVINPRAQVITAAGAASVSAIAITSWLLDEDVAAAERGHGMSAGDVR